MARVIRHGDLNVLDGRRYGNGANGCGGDGSGSGLHLGMIHVLRARGVAAKRGITAEHGVDLRPSLGLVERIDRTRNDRDAIWSGRPSAPMTVRARTGTRNMRGSSRTGIGERGLESGGLDLFFGEMLRAGIHKVAGYGEQADSSERAGDKRHDLGAQRLVDSLERQSRGICGQRQRHAQPR